MEESAEVNIIDKSKKSPQHRGGSKGKPLLYQGLFF